MACASRGSVLDRAAMRAAMQKRRHSKGNGSLP
jgi:hypothetical protein